MNLTDQPIDPLAPATVAPATVAPATLAPDTLESLMEQHTPDRVALVFGLAFTTIGLVSLAGLTDVAGVDGGVVAGAALLVAAALIAVMTLADRRGRDTEAPVDEAFDIDAEVIDA